jgi:tetratricopeptide (TPR) repeat protein
MSNRWALLFVMTHIAGFGGAVTAQTLDQQRQCPATDPDVSINGCTAMIQSGHETQQKLAIDFYNRGLAYLLKDQYDRAIEDFDQAIRINPNYALAFNSRGHTYFGKGLGACRPASLRPCALAVAQYDRAIEDFDQAIRLNPNDAMAAWAYGERSTVKSVKGDFAGPAADLAKATQLLNLLDPSVGK